MMFIRKHKIVIFFKKQIKSNLVIFKGYKVPQIGPNQMKIGQNKGICNIFGPEDAFKPSK